ncbi:efflux RND transporter permease subunit, partial [Acinetobacter baumannii]
SSAPLVVSHQQQLPAVTVSFNVAPGYSLSEAVRAIQETKDSLDMPAHLHAEFIGKAAEFTGSQTDVVWLLLASLVVIYIVL